MGAIFQIKRFFDLKKLLFILPLIFCFSFSYSGYCDCGYLSLCPMVSPPKDLSTCKCYSDAEGKKPIPVSECVDCTKAPCYSVSGGGCYSSAWDACEAAGFSSASGYGGELPKHWKFIDGGGNIDTYCWKDCDNGDSSCRELHKIVNLDYKCKYEMEDPPNSDLIIRVVYCSGDDCHVPPIVDPVPDETGQSDEDNSLGEPTQKMVCYKGSCKCFNIKTNYEEACLGNIGGSSGSGTSSSGGSNSSGDNGSGSGTGNGSGDSGNGQGSGSESSPSSGNGTNSGAGGDNSGTGTGSNNGDNSGGGTHTGSSGNQHGGGGIGFGGGSDNGSDNGNDNGKEDGSEDGDDYCLKNPKSIVCKGEPKQGDFDDIVIPRKEVNDSWVKDMFLPDNGTCPAPLKANFLGKTISISYEPLCRLLNQVRFAILLLFAYISARLGLGGKV